MFESLGLMKLFGVLASGAFSKAKGVASWIGGLDVIHLLAVVLAILLVVDHVGLILAHRHLSKVEKSLASALNADKADRAALLASRTNESALRAALADQNGRVGQLAAESEAQQSAALKARQAAAERIASAEAIAARLAAQSRQKPAPGAPAAPCGPSDLVKGQWK